jgi:hypothetical protein
MSAILRCRTSWRRPACVCGLLFAQISKKPLDQRWDDHAINEQA